MNTNENSKPAGNGPKSNTERRFLACILTPEERAEHSLALARANQEITQLEDSKKSAVKQFDAQIASQKAHINKESQIVSKGEEYREVLCVWVLNFPEPGRKALMRDDTRAVVETMHMDASDNQLAI